MSYQLSSDVDGDKIFLANFSDVSGARFDAHYYQPKYDLLDAKLDALNAQSLYKLSEKIFSGITPLSGGDAYAEEGVAFVRSGDFNEDGTINENDLIYLKPEIHQGLMKGSQLQKGDILFAIVGATIGKVGLFEKDYEANINQAVGAIRPHSELRSHFLHAFFLSDLGQQQIERVKRPVARANINLEELGNLRVPLLDEDASKRAEKQTRIENVLFEGFQNKRNKEAQAKAQLAAIDALLLRELGITPATSPPNTVESRCFIRQFSEVTGGRLDPLFHQEDLFAFVREGDCALVPLGDYVSNFVTGFAAGYNEQSDEKTGVIQIRPTNLSSDRELIFDRNIYIHADEMKTRKTDLIGRGEVLFNNTNSQEQVGKTVLFDEAGDYFCSNHITRIHSDSRVDSRYLTHVLNLYQRKKVFFRLCTNWNNQSGVGRDILEKLLIPLPDINKQIEIADLIDKERNQAKALFAQAQDELDAAKTAIEAMILGDDLT